MKASALFSAALALFTYQTLPAQTVEVLKVAMSKKIPEKAESIVFGSFNSEAGTVATLLIHPAEGSSVVAVLEDGHEITGVTDEKGNAVKDMEAVFKDFGSKAADDGSCGVVEVEIPLAGEDGPAQVIVTGTLSVQIAKGTKESKTDAIDDLIGKELKVGEETCELQSLTRESDGVGFSLKFNKRADFIKQVIVLDGDKEVPAESRGWSRSGFGDKVEEQRDYAAPTKGKGLKLKFILHDEVKTEPLEFKVTLPAKF